MSTLLFSRGIILAAVPLYDRILVRCLFQPPYGTHCYNCNHLSPFAMLEQAGILSLHVNCPWCGQLPVRPEKRVQNEIILMLSPTNFHLSPGDEAIHLPLRRRLGWIRYGQPAETLKELSLLT